jgi:hypothetical protein
MSLIYQPFQAEIPNQLSELEGIDSAENLEQIVEELPDENGKIPNVSALNYEIIEERDGVNYIANVNLDVNMKNIDASFKELVDSVLKRET